MKSSIFDYEDYKEFLKDSLLVRPGSWGRCTKLANHLRCQPSYVSRVLLKEANFTPEQAFRINSFFGHNDSEAEYFVLLVLRQRSGSTELRDYYDLQIQKHLDKRKNISSRITAKQQLSQSEQARYYSNWIYCTVHILCGVPGFQTPSALARHLNLPIETVVTCLNFLVKNGLVEKNRERFSPAKRRIHIPSTSPFITQHHTNWRFKALDSIQKDSSDDLHYSAVYSLSKEDFDKVRNLFVEFIQESDKIIVPSPRESAIGVTLDLFKI